MLKGLYVLSPASYQLIYSPADRGVIAQHLDVYAPPQTPQSVKETPAILRDLAVLVSGWGGPVLDEPFLAAAPRLELVLYGAGSIRGLMTPLAWDRGIRVTSAYGANAIPVAEYTLSQVLWCLKRGWHYALATRQAGAYPPRVPVAGAYGSVVGIISLGMVGRRVCELLQAFDVEVIAYDPFATAETARQLEVELCALDEVFRRADVVSVHTPWLKETEGLITGVHFAAMRPNAAFINTARGAVVREPEMTAVLQQRPDLTAVLDVTHPEPPKPGSPLYTLPNVILTPHIAGSMDAECWRMGHTMAEELVRFVRGEPLRWEIHRDQASILA